MRKFSPVLYYLSTKTLNDPVSSGDAFYNICKKRANRVTEMVNDIFKCRKNFVSESPGAQLFPYLLYGVHLWRIGRYMKYGDVFWNFKGPGFTPRRSATTKKNPVF